MSDHVSVDAGTENRDADTVENESGRIETAGTETARTEKERTDPDPRLLRALADLDNVRRRYERRLETEAATERDRVAALWLPIVDDLERALEYADADVPRVAEGIRAVYEHALGVLEELGYERFDDLGMPFDPRRHEAVSAIETNAPAGSVVGVVRPGYAQRQGVLRPAGVVIARTRA
ncbi:MAG: GrpE protein [Actinomycetia bacterium]|nr:GrpE protein [Actinomycetes bacterium]